MDFTTSLVVKVLVCIHDECVIMMIWDLYDFDAWTYVLVWSLIA